LDQRDGEGRDRPEAMSSDKDTGGSPPGKGLMKHISKDGREFWVSPEDERKLKRRKSSKKRRKSNLKGKLSGLLLLLLFLAPVVMIGYSFMIDGKQIRYGQIRVISDVKDAAIYLDGEFTEKATNATLRNVTPGKHIVSVIKPGYRGSEAEVEVKSRETVELRFNLKPIEQ